MGIFLVSPFLSVIRGILNFSDPRISVTPQFDEFLVVCDGFGGVAMLILDLAEYVKASGVEIARERPSSCLLLLLSIFND